MYISIFLDTPDSLQKSQLNSISSWLLQTQIGILPKDKSHGYELTSQMENLN